MKEKTPWLRCRQDGNVARDARMPSKQTLKFKRTEDTTAFYLRTPQAHSTPRGSQFHEMFASPYHSVTVERAVVTMNLDLVLL